MPKQNAGGFHVKKVLLFFVSPNSELVPPIEEDSNASVHPCIERMNKLAGLGIVNNRVM